MRLVILAVIGPLLTAGCDPPVEVSHPFYLMYIEDPDDTSLFRCPGDVGCAGDGLPGPFVFAAGADARYVVVARHPKYGDYVDLDRTEYFYFARVPEENSGWGNNPERIVGPLSQAEFDLAKRRLRLPPFTVHPTWRSEWING